MDKQFENPKEWSNTAIELGVIGAIGAGIGASILKGSASGVSAGSKKTVKHVGKNVDRYLEKNVFKRNPMGRFIYRSMKKVPANSSRIKRDGDRAIADLQFDMGRINYDTGQERKRLALSELADAMINKREPRGIDEIFDSSTHRLKLKAEAGDKWRSGQKSDYLMSEKNNTATSLGKTPPQKEKKSLFSEGVGAAVTGIGFGAGLTAFHALDKKLLGDDKKKNRSYEAAGSYINKNASGAADAYRKVESFSERIPQAIANGIGYTGVTLGTASLLEKIRADARKKAGTDTASPQVVIVNEGTPSKKQTNQTLKTIHSLSNSNPQQDIITKQAGSDQWLQSASSKLKTFGKNLLGHGDERRALMKRINQDGFSYDNEAIRSTTKKELDHLSEVYGKAFNEEKSREMALGEVSRNLKNNDQAKHNELYDSMAKARLQTLGGVGLVGGIASIARPKQEGQR